MLRFLILTFYLFTFLVGPSSAMVLCYHPAHGLKVETSHEKDMCVSVQTSVKAGIQKSSTSCNDSQLFEKNSTIPYIVSIQNLLSFSSTFIAPIVMPSISVGIDFVSFSTHLSSVSKHISSTVLRI